MARVGIDVSRALGVSVPDIRAIAKRCGTDHELALELWTTGEHEARMLAGLITRPDAFTDDQMESWVADLSSWGLCDLVAEAFGATPAGIEKIRAWARRPEAS
jgi:3-methyladenine DNA glycosylase AlkD